MEPDWASENLQIIRTLMERSAVYRHALAPVMATVGLTGIAAAVIEALLHLKSTHAFALYWMCAGAICVIEAFLLIRRQALQKAELFWTPPTRRITQALSPAFFSGVMGGFIFLRFDDGNQMNAWLLVPGWMVLYGCALHAAGFFMPRGVKVFGWAFILAGGGFGLAALCLPVRPSLADANWAMGALFGGSHWAYGTYLYFTEQRRRMA